MLKNHHFWDLKLTRGNGGGKSFEFLVLSVELKKDGRRRSQEEFRESGQRF
jgi:hypothetical protein